MTTKLREEMISLSRNQKKRIEFMILGLIIISAMFLMCFFEKIVILWILALLGFCLLLVIDEALDAIKKQKDEVIEKNKLLYIVLSERRVVEKLVEYFIWLPIVFIICNFAKINFFTGAIIVIVALVGISKLSYIITTHFKNKLSKE